VRTVLLVQAHTYTHIRTCAHTHYTNIKEHTCAVTLAAIASYREGCLLQQAPAGYACCRPCVFAHIEADTKICNAADAA